MQTNGMFEAMRKCVG